MKFKTEQIINVFKNHLRLKLNGIWFSGERGEGEFKEWYDDKQLWKHCFYESASLNGEFKTWHEDGKLFEHCWYKDDNYDGEYKSWNESGELEKHFLYKNDKIIKDYLK